MSEAHRVPDACGKTLMARNHRTVAHRGTLAIRGTASGVHIRWCPSLTDTVWVGMSGGSMVMTPRIGQEFVGWQSPDGGDDRTLRLVDFSIFPHLDDAALPNEHDGRRREVGGRHRRSGLRDRQRDRHQGDRRGRRGRLRGPVEVLPLPGRARSDGLDSPHGTPDLQHQRHPGRLRRPPRRHRR